MRLFKILFLGFCIVLFSCGDEEYFDGDDIFTDLTTNLVNEHYDNKTYFNPPEWIIGRWYSNEYDKSRIQFTQNNVIHRHFGYGNRWHNYDYNEQLNKIRWGDYSWLLIEETATDSTYFFSKMKNDRQKFIYNQLFQKISNDSIIQIYSSDSSDGRNDTIRYGRD
jgi:hypothetical protein